MYRHSQLIKLPEVTPLRPSIYVNDVEVRLDEVVSQPEEMTPGLLLGHEVRGHNGDTNADT